MPFMIASTARYIQMNSLARSKIDGAAGADRWRHHFPPGLKRNVHGCAEAFRAWSGKPATSSFVHATRTRFLLLAVFDSGAHRGSAATQSCRETRGSFVDQSAMPRLLGKATSGFELGFAALSAFLMAAALRT